ncbi:MAG: hypothetical protein ACOYKA_03570 [Legionellaceae bacterium]
MMGRTSLSDEEKNKAAAKAKADAQAKAKAQAPTPPEAEEKKKDDPNAGEKKQEFPGDDIEAGDAFKQAMHDINNPNKHGVVIGEFLKDMMNNLLEGLSKALKAVVSGVASIVAYPFKAAFGGKEQKPADPTAGPSAGPTVDSTADPTPGPSSSSSVPSQPKKPLERIDRTGMTPEEEGELNRQVKFAWNTAPVSEYDWFSRETTHYSEEQIDKNREQAAIRAEHAWLETDAGQAFQSRQAQAPAASGPTPEVPISPMSDTKTAAPGASAAAGVSPEVMANYAAGPAAARVPQTPAPTTPRLEEPSSGPTMGSR